MYTESTVLSIGCYGYIDTTTEYFKALIWKCFEMLLGLIAYKEEIPRVLVFQKNNKKPYKNLTSRLLRWKKCWEYTPHEGSNLCHRHLKPSIDTTTRFGGSMLNVKKLYFVVDSAFQQ